MDGVNRKVVGAFAGIMLAVALTLLNVWQLGLAVLAGVAGYLIAGLYITRRWRALWRKRQQ